MKGCLSSLIVILVVLTIPRDLRAEHQISLGAGSIRTLHQGTDPGDLPQWTVYPEISWHLLFPGLSYTLLFQFDGSIYFGYWDDRVSSVVDDCADCLTYSYGGAVYGGRLTMYLRRMFIPLGLTVGYGFHDINQEYIGGRGVDGEEGSDDEFLVRSPELGVTVLLPVSRAVQLEVLGLRYFHETDVNPGQNRYMVRGVLRLSL